MGGKPGVDGVDQRALQAQRGRGLLEGLELDEQLVDDAGDAFAVALARPHGQPPMASSSSMNPMAPPSRRACRRNALK